MQLLANQVELHDEAESLVYCYNEGTRLLTKAYDLLERSEKQLDHSANFPRTLPEGHNRSVRSGDLKRIIAENKRRSWRRVIERLQLQNLMSSKRFREVQEQIDAGEIPDLTVPNLHALCEDLTSDMAGFLQECIAETFNRLRPRNAIHKYKTNKISKVGQKAILSDTVEFSPGWWRLLNSQELTSMDNVFHLLDGKGFVKHPGDLVTQIEDTMRKTRGTWCETEYFHVTWYKVGSMHIVFKRDDLRAELNRIGGGGRPNIG